MNIRNTELQAARRLPLPTSFDRASLPGTFWTPSAEFIWELADYLKGRRVLEIFAGNGLLAGLLAARGVDVTATSLLSGMDAHDRGLYFPVQVLEAIAAVDHYGNAADVLLICWPTTTESVTRAVHRWGRERDIVFIGEVTDYSKGHLGGCATDSFFAGFTPRFKFDSYRRRGIEDALVGYFDDEKWLTASALNALRYPD